MKFFISTTSDIDYDPSRGCFDTYRSREIAEKYDCGLEIADFCIADNLDGERLQATHDRVKNKLRGFEECILHAPFNEIYPSAIDPLAIRLANFRLDQALEFAKKYNAKKMVVHSGFVPSVYFESWFLPQSVKFWRKFLDRHPENITLCVENVMETSPELLFELAAEINDPRLRLTLDIGHAHRNSEIPVTAWIEKCAPYISHFHIHNNEGLLDTHSPLPEGTIPMTEVMERISGLCPDSTVTLECLQPEVSAKWLIEAGYL